MSFLHPLILAAGMGAVALPVVIHFLRRRRRPIPWAAMRFLRQAVHRRRRRLRLEQLLLLLMRCALVALLALAVARPALGGRAGSALPTVLVLAIDDSIGSALIENDQTALSRAVGRARDALDALDPAGGDRAGLVTLGAPGRTPVWPPTGDLDALRRALDRLEPTDSAPTLRALGDALGQLTTGDDAPARVVLRILSDWRGPHGADLLAGAPTTTGARIGQVRVDPPATGTRENTGIRSLLVSTPVVLREPGPGGADPALAPPARATVTLVRSTTAGEQTADIEIIAQPGGVIAGRAQARFAPGSGTARAVVTIDEGVLTPGRAGRVALEARIAPDANPRDNTARAVLTVRPELRVGVVERPPQPGADAVAPGVWVLAALMPDDRTRIRAFRIDPASLASTPPASVDALIVLEPSRLGDDAWTRAREVLARGGLVVIVPDPGQGPLNWGDNLARLTGGAVTLAAGAASVETDTRLSTQTDPAGVLAGLAGEFADLARAVGVRRMIPLVTAPTGDQYGPQANRATTLIATEDARPFAVQAPGPAGVGLSVVFASAFDLGWSDLPARPAFVPVMQEIVRRGAGRNANDTALAGTPPPDDPDADRWAPDAQLNDKSGDRPDPATPTGVLDGVLDGARAGVLVGISAEGAVVRTLTINPDADAARTQPIDADALRAAVQAAYPHAETVMDAAAVDQPGNARTGKPRPTPGGDRAALLLLAAAAALAVLETIAARAASHPNPDPAAP